MVGSTSMSCVQAELEDEILQLLSSATGNLLDNIQLINTLNASKTTWEQVNQSLQVCCLITLENRASSLHVSLEHALLACIAKWSTCDTG